MPCYYDDQRKSWYTKFYDEDYTGKRKQKLKRGFKRKGDAQAFEREFLLNMANSPDITFKTLRDAYIEHCTPRLKQSTIQQKQYVINCDIAPYFDNKPINQITPLEVAKWQAAIQSKGLKPTTLRNINAQLIAIMNFAVKYKGLPKNPCIEPMGSATRAQDNINFWTLAEYNNFIKHVDDIQYRIFYEMLYYTGMRKGELMALTLQDIDFSNLTVRINKTLYYKTKNKRSTPPKTANSNRTVSIPENVAADLLEYTKRVYDIDMGYELFFLSVHDIENYKDKVCRQHGIRNIRVHDLRHSHVSLLVDMGVDMFLIADRIGDNVATVQRTYAHLYPNKRASVAEKLNKLVSQ